MTTEGPTLNFPCPRKVEFVAVGKIKLGPMPQITLLFFGTRKNEGFMSPNP
jgi:hypothetical protein